MNRILVTGASGSVGGPVCEALAAAGYAVRAAMRDPHAQVFPDSVEVARLPDLAGQVDWTPLVAGVDAAVHLAANASAQRTARDDRHDRVNHVATATFAQAAAAAGLRRFVFISSIRAQSRPSATEPLSEADPPRPAEAYGRSKLAAEQAVRASGVPYTILRPAAVYGPRSKGNIARLALLAGLPIPLPFGALRAPRSLLGLDNLISAIRFALENARALNETFIVADAETTNVAEIVTTLRLAAGRRAALIPVPPRLLALVFTLIGQRHTWEQLSGALIARPKKLMAAGWHPVVDTRAGLAAMVKP